MYLPHILLNAFTKRCHELAIQETNTVLIVQVSTKRLFLLQKGKCVKTYPISTAKNGIGQEIDSAKTPLGLHIIEEKIGSGAALYSVFKSRSIVDQVALPSQGERFITTRILRLRGLDAGFNSGFKKAISSKEQDICVDSWERYIYIHGSNDIDEIGIIDGTGGCVCMKPEDIADLFEYTPSKALVYIAI